MSIFFVKAVWCLHLFAISLNKNGNVDACPYHTAILLLHLFLLILCFFSLFLFILSHFGRRDFYIGRKKNEQIEKIHCFEYIVRLAEKWNSGTTATTTKLIGHRLLHNHFKNKFLFFVGAKYILFQLLLLLFYHKRFLLGYVAVCICFVLTKRVKLLVRKAALYDMNKVNISRR